MASSASPQSHATRESFPANAPLLAATLFFTAGILLPRVLPASTLPLWFFWGLGICFAFATVVAHRLHRKTLALALTLSIFLIFGILRSPQPGPPSDPHHIFHSVQEQEEVVLLGILRETPTYRKHDSRLLVEATEIWTPTDRKTCRGRVQLDVAGEPVTFLSPGDFVLARAKLSLPRDAGTPGAFDYRDFLAQRSVWVTGRVASTALLARPEASTPQPLPHTLRYLPERARQRIGTFLDRHLPEETRGLYRAIIIGDLSDIPALQLEKFRSTGTMHLLAISGMNIGLITLTVTSIAWWLLCRSQWVLLHLPAKKIALCLTIPFMLLYALVAGFQAPVVRALIMVLVFIAATLLDRQWRVANNIAIAALLLLSFSPGELFTVSFQLSFAAVIAIACLAEPLRALAGFTDQAEPRPLAHTIFNWCVAGILASLAATAGTMPLMLYHFNRFSLLSPISTLLVEPFLCFWAQMPGLLACLFIPVAPRIAATLLDFGGLGVQASAWLVEQLARVPAREVWLPTPGFPEIIAWYVLALTLLLWRRNAWARLAGVVAASLLVVMPVAASLKRQHATELQVHFLDVGQGSATLAELPGGRTVLIDAGGHETERFNVGEDIVAPFLWHKGITRLDTIVVTHPHADHANGLPFLVKRFRPATVWVNGDAATTPALAALHAAATRTDSRIVPVEPGDEILAAQAFSLRCLGRFGETSEQSRSAGDEDAARQAETNRESLVLRLDGGGASFLFPGDIGVAEEKKLLAREPDLKVDVLLAPHHGSRSSNSAPFVRASRARFVVFSAGGRKNAFPAAEVRERYEAVDARILETRRDGTITFTAGGEGLRVETFRKSRKEGE